ncbi:MAG: hypothetical protein LKI57_02340 [Acetobacter lovaniensis]|jgi:ribosome-associated heat shock protein Hsp15|nr:hypothetical protein [Acetobacter lovaniensis]
MQFRRASVQPQESQVTTEAIRLLRWWRGYQKGQVARFPTEITAQLKAKGWAAPYKPTKEEAQDDALRVRIQEEGLELDRQMRNGAMANQAEALSRRTVAR